MSSIPLEPTVELPEPGGERRATPAVYAHEVARSSANEQALDDISFRRRAGQIHALLRPNGAGKTTLLRISPGCCTRTRARSRPRATTRPRTPTGAGSGSASSRPADRTFYLRLSGSRTCVFFGRLYGLKRKAATARALEVIEQVGLGDAVKVRVGVYSHGMQKRLSMARALLTEPDVLLIDEATHDLDPEGAMRVRDLVAAQAQQNGPSSGRRSASRRSAASPTTSRC